MPSSASLADEPRREDVSPAAQEQNHSTSDAKSLPDPVSPSTSRNSDPLHPALSPTVALQVMRPNDIESPKTKQAHTTILPPARKANKEQLARHGLGPRSSSDASVRSAASIGIRPISHHAVKDSAGLQEQQSQVQRRPNEDARMQAPAPSPRREAPASSSQLSSEPTQSPSEPDPIASGGRAPLSSNTLPASSPTVASSSAPHKEVPSPCIDDSGFVEAVSNGPAGGHQDREARHSSPSPGSVDSYTDEDDSDVDMTMIHSSSEDDQLARYSEPPKPKPVKSKTKRRLRHTWTAKDIDVVLQVVKEELAVNPQRLTIARWEAIRTRWAQLRGFRPGRAPSLSQLRFRLGGLRASGDPRFKLLKEEAAARKEGRPYDPDMRTAALLAETSPIRRDASSPSPSPATTVSAPAAGTSSTAPRHNFLCTWTPEEERLLLELFSRPEAINQRSMMASVAYVYGEWNKRVDGVTYHARSSSALGERLRNIARREGSALDQEAFELWKKLPCGTGKVVSHVSLPGASSSPTAPTYRADFGAEPAPSQIRKRPAPLDISPLSSSTQPTVRSEAPAFKKHVKTRMTNNSLAAAPLDIFGSAASTEAMELEMQGQRHQIDELASELRKMHERVKHAEEALAAQGWSGKGARVDGDTSRLEQRCNALEKGQSKLRQDSIQAWDDMVEARKKQKEEMEEMAKKVLEPVALLLKSQVEIKERLAAMERKMDLLGSSTIGAKGASGVATGEEPQQPHRNGDAHRELGEDRQRIKARERELQWEAARQRYKERESQAPKAASERDSVGVAAPLAQEYYQTEDDMELDAPSRILTPCIDGDEALHSARSSNKQYCDAARAYREPSRAGREASEAWNETQTPTTTMTMTSRLLEQRPSPSVVSPFNGNGAAAAYHHDGQRASGMVERTESGGSRTSLRQALDGGAPPLPSPSSYRPTGGAYAQQQHEMRSASRPPLSPAEQQQPSLPPQQQQHYNGHSYARAEADGRSRQYQGASGAEDESYARRYMQQTTQSYAPRGGYNGHSQAAGYQYQHSQAQGHAPGHAPAHAGAQGYVRNSNGTAVPQQPFAGRRHCSGGWQQQLRPRLPEAMRCSWPKQRSKKLGRQTSTNIASPI